eukprot:766592-Hanusia_phi.AAC.1
MNLGFGLEDRIRHGLVSSLLLHSLPCTFLSTSPSTSPLVLLIPSHSSFLLSPLPSSPSLSPRTALLLPLLLPLFPQYPSLSSLLCSPPSISRLLPLLSLLPSSLPPLALCSPPHSPTAESAGGTNNSTCSVPAASTIPCDSTPLICSLTQTQEEEEDKERREDAIKLE